MFHSFHLRGGVKRVLTSGQLIYKSFGGVRFMSFTRFLQFNKYHAHRAKGLFMGTRVILRNSNNGHFTFILGLGTLFYLSNLIRTIVMSSTRRGATNGFIGSGRLTILGGVVCVLTRGTSYLSYLISVIGRHYIFRVRRILGTRVFLNFFGTSLDGHYHTNFFIGRRVTIVYIFDILLFIRLNGLIRFRNTHGVIYPTMGINKLVTTTTSSGKYSYLVSGGKIGLIRSYRVITSLRLLLFVGRRIISRVVRTRFIINTMNSVTIMYLLTLHIYFFIGSGTYTRARRAMGLTRPFTITLYGMVICNGSVRTLTLGHVGMDQRDNRRNFTFTNFRFNGSTLIRGSTTSGLRVGILRSRRSPHTLTTGHRDVKRGVIGHFTYNGPIFRGLYLKGGLFITRFTMFVFGHRGLIYNFLCPLGFFYKVVTRSDHWGFVYRCCASIRL